MYSKEFKMVALKKLISTTIYNMKVDNESLGLNTTFKYKRTSLNKKPSPYI